MRAHVAFSAGGVQILKLRHCVRGAVFAKFQTEGKVRATCSSRSSGVLCYSRLKLTTVRHVQCCSAGMVGRFGILPTILVDSANGLTKSQQGIVGLWNNRMPRTAGV